MTTEQLTTRIRVCIFIAMLSVVAPARAINVSLNADDLLANNESSFNSALHWDNGQAPSAGNDYFNANFLLRTPADGNSYTFGGNSLTITSDAAPGTNLTDALMFKGTGTAAIITVNNLTIDGGNLRHAQGDIDTFTLAGNGLTVGPLGMGVHIQGPTFINSPVLGSGDITIVDNGSDAAARTLHFMSGSNTFNGNINLPTINRSRFALDAGANLSFTIGSPGVNNSISGAGVATLDGIFNFNLSGATANPGDSWTIVNQGTLGAVTYGPTFAVSGSGFSNVGGFWHNGTYLFNPSDGTLSVAPVPNVWNVNGGGNWNVPGNWSSGVPLAGSNVIFGPVLTAANAPATINLNVPASHNRLTFSNANQYILTGANTLTLTGAAEVAVTSGSHEIGAVIAGSAGLVKTGAGELTLSANNTYSGLTDVQGGILRIRNTGAVDGIVNVATGAALFFQGNNAGGGFSGAFGPDIQGPGEINLSGTLTTETVTFNNAKSYTGQTVVRGGTLAISSSTALGAALGDEASRTLITGNTQTGRLALAGNIAVGTEVLAFEGRQGAALNAVHLTSAGNNSWAGNVRGAQAGGNQYNIESTSGTLTLSGIVSAFDEAAARTFVFSGAGDTNITGKLTDEVTDGGSGVVTGPSANINVNVIKRGAGTLTISTASAIATDYWMGPTTIEGGTLEVISDGFDSGELASFDITVRSGATLDIDHFTTYELFTNQNLAGAGTIRATGKTLALNGSNGISPGDSVGTLTIQGAVTLSDAGGNGHLIYELGDTPSTVGGTENDLIQINGSLVVSGTPFMTVNVRPVEGDLGAGSYRLINHVGGGVANVSGMNALVVNNTGEALTNLRQTVTVASIANQVNLTVTGNEASRSWSGANSNWDVATSNSWVEGDLQFRHLDDVTFGSTPANKNVIVNTNVSPGSVNFSGGAGSTYTLSGSGGITGFGPVNVNSGTVRLANTGNNFAGTTTVASGARLETGSAVTGSIVVANGGTLSLGSTAVTMVVDNFGAAGLGEYTLTRVLEQAAGVAEANVSLSDSTGALVASYAGTANAPEQVLLLRGDASLGVGQTLLVDVSMPVTASEMDFGIAVSDIVNPTSVADPTPLDTRNTFDWASISVRPSQNAIRNNRSIDGTVTTGANVVGGVDETTVRQLFIERTSSTNYAIGYINSSAVRTDAASFAFTDTSVGTAIGFYGDLRAAGGSLGSLDNLRILSGSPSSTVDVNGNFNLAATGTLELDIAQTGFSMLDITGTATLDGTIAVELLGGFMPNVGSQFTVLSAAGGITDLGINYVLPANFTAQIINATNLVLTYGLLGDYNLNGVVDSADYVLWRNTLGTNVTPFSGADGDGNGVIQEADYTVWRSRFGNTLGAGSGSSAGQAAALVPEPATWLSFLLASAVAMTIFRRRG